jgi:hypothetical protein
VAECWLGDIPNGYEVDHIDRNAHNNDYRNLRYVTKSEQMKNRNHSNISATGCKNLEAARRQRMKPIRLRNENQTIIFESIASCARFLSDRYGKDVESMRYRLRKNPKKIYDFYVKFLNAETGHDSSTEQGTVHSYVI